MGHRSSQDPNRPLTTMSELIAISQQNRHMFQDAAGFEKDDSFDDDLPYDRFPDDLPYGSIPDDFNFGRLSLDDSSPSLLNWPLPPPAYHHPAAAAGSDPSLRSMRVNSAAGMYYGAPDYSSMNSNAIMNQGFLNSNAAINQGFLNSNAVMNQGFLNSNAAINQGFLNPNSNAAINQGFLNPNSNAAINQGFLNSNAAMNQAFLNPNLNQGFLNSNAAMSQAFLNSNGGMAQGFLNPNAGMNQSFLNPNAYWDPYLARSSMPLASPYRNGSTGRNNASYNLAPIRSNSRARCMENGGFHDQDSYLGSSSSSSGLHPGAYMPNVSIEDLRGKVVMLAKEQYGVSMLKKKIEEGNKEDLDVIFSEVRDHVSGLVTHLYGYSLIIRLCEVCDDQQMTGLVVLLFSEERSLMSICLDSNGSKVIQKMIQTVKTAEQRSVIVHALKHITDPLTKSTNGNHVIQMCLTQFPDEDKMHILNVVAANCIDIAMDKSGCCVLQACIPAAKDLPQTLNHLIEQIIREAVTLSEHPYGNYVVQYMIMQKMRNAFLALLDSFRGHIVALSTNKFGSHVVEKFLRECDPDIAVKIINEMIMDPHQFMTIVQNPFGNYVAQSAFFVAKGALRNKLIGLVQDNYAFLHSHPHGKRVLACAKPHHRSSRMSM